MNTSRLCLSLLCLGLWACTADKKPKDSGTSQPINERVGIDASKLDSEPDKSSQDSAANGSYFISSNCAGSFTIKADYDSVSSLANFTSFPGCETLAAMLDKQSLPSGKFPESLQGGDTVSAKCVQGSLEIKVMELATHTNTINTLVVSDNQTCVELRNIINSAKL